MKPVALLILDGWGWSERQHGNAVALAATPNFESYWNTSPHTLINTSGLFVGLPEGVMGNSEVGHLNIGAGRIVYQDLTRINESVRKGEIGRNPLLHEIFTRLKLRQRRLHFLGLLSDGGVHSHISHLFALMDAANIAGVDVVVHPLLDGRDTSPTAGVNYLERLSQKCNELGNAVVGSVGGRYYTMDRDKRWDRVKVGFDVMVHGEGERIEDPVAAVRASYAADVTDEFVVPKVVVKNGAPVGKIADEDQVLFFNFRGDRAREISMALADEDFPHFDRGNRPKIGGLICMTQYHQDFAYPVLYPPIKLNDLLGEVVSRHGKRQLRIAETEKYAHVTFFFNGGREDAFVGEERLLIPSPKDVATYDQKPEMSAFEVTNQVVERIEAGSDDLIVLNYANADMVGHTGVIEAAVKAVETVDKCMGQVVQAIVKRGGAVIVTSDHGNAEEMRTIDDRPQTAHSTNPVPCFLVGSDKKMRDGGMLADLAPTILELMELPKPEAMTGSSLLI